MSGQIIPANPAASARGPLHSVRRGKTPVLDVQEARALIEHYLSAYLNGRGLHEDRKGPLFRTIGRKTKRLSGTPLPQANGFTMVRRRAVAAGIQATTGNHSFRATGITAYLKNGGTLETAAAMANHASTRTTQLYDRRHVDVTFDEIERVLI